MKITFWMPGNNIEVGLCPTPRMSVTWKEKQRGHSCETSHYRRAGAKGGSGCGHGSGDPEVECGWSRHAPPEVAPTLCVHDVKPEKAGRLLSLDHYVELGGLWDQGV